MSLLTDLLSIPDVDTVMDTEVLPAMRSRGLNVDAWGTFDPWRILAYVTATLRVGARTVQAGFGAAGFGEYAFGNQTPPSGLDVTGWAPLRASSWYGVQQIQATYTQRSIKLANSTGSAYGPLRAGSIILKFTATGNRYILQDDGITIPANGSLQATFRSEFPVNSAAGLSYGDLPNATIVFVTSQFPGVTATNPSTTFSTVSQAGSGLGTLTLTGTTGDGQHNFAVKITGSGQAGSATWSVSTDGGAFVNQNNSSSASNVGGLGVNIALTNDTGGSSPSFLVGSIYFFATPGTDLVAAGRDVETPQQLGRRCYALWTMLGFPRDKATGLPLIWQPTAAAVEAILLSLSDQVAVALVQTSTTLNATVNLYVAGQGALLPSAVLAALQAFWSNVGGAFTTYVVSAPQTTGITLGGATVKCKAAQIATAKAAAQNAVNAYLTGVDPKNLLTIGDGSTVLVDRSYLNSLIRSTSGVTHLDDGLTINGSAADFTPAAGYLCTYSGDVGSSLTWIAV